MNTGLRMHRRADPESLKPLIAQAFRTTGALAIALILLTAIYAVLDFASR
jgi:hypothetical protein